MATLQGMKNEARDSGFTDASCGRLYKHSFNDYLKGMGLIVEYDCGWAQGRRQREIAQRRG